MMESPAAGDPKRSPKYFRDDISLRLPGDEDISHKPTAPTDKDFKLYTMDLSFFSGKMEMYLRYKEVSFERIEPHAYELDTILYENTWTEQVPQLYDCRKTTSEAKRWLRDTSPMIEYLEQDPLISEHSLPVIPSCEFQAFFQRLIEDYCDEHLWRPAMFWRWEPGFDREAMALRFCWEFARTCQRRYILFPSIIRPYLMALRQWLLSSYGEDCTTQAKKEVVKQQYYELLEVLEEILSEQPYLFGNRPTLVDFGFSGPFFRHFSSDFTPRKVMQQVAPAVYEWVARLWNCKCSKVKDLPTGFPEPGQLPKNWNRLLQLIPDYLEYSHLNAVAYSNGSKYFHWVNKGETFMVPTVHYRAWCRMKLQHRFQALSDSVKPQVQKVLDEYGCWQHLWADGVIDVAPECGTDPPFVVGNAASENKTRLAYKWDHNAVFLPFFLKTLLTTAHVGAILAVVASHYWKKA